MKSYVSIILALLGIMLFGIIGGCSSDTDSPTTTRRNESESSYTTTADTTKDRTTDMMESASDKVSEKFSEAGSDIKDMMPEKENGVITTKRERQ